MVRITPISRIDARLDDWSWGWAEQNETRIAAYWEDLHHANPALFDGEILLMCSGARVGDVFRCRYFKTRFSRFIAWRDWGYPDPLVRNGFAMNALQSRDGAYLLGVMGVHTSNAGKMYFPAGTPDLSDLVDGMVDLSGSAVRELSEETGFGEAELEAADGWTLVESASQVAYLRHCRLRYPARDAIERFAQWQKGQDRPELAGLHPVFTKADLEPERMHAYLLGWFDHVLG